MSTYFHEQESATLEFKEKLPSNDQLIKVVIGFCNQFGGRLMIGIADNLEIKGISESEARQALKAIPALIYESCFPPIIIRASVQQMANCCILIIDVSEGMNKPYYKKALGVQAGTYLRLGSSTLKATPELIADLQRQSRALSFDQSPVYSLNPSNLSSKEILAFLKQRTNSSPSLKKVDPTLLRALKLVLDEHGKSYPTVAGLLLFGSLSDAFFPESYILCTEFKGTEGRDILRSLECRGNLFVQLDQAYEFILASLSKSQKIVSKKREEHYEIPELAIREILINAIVHRNFAVPAPIKVAIFRDRIEIFSPGNFPGPLRTEDLEKGISYIRNPVICKIFREAGLIEKLGSGFATVFSLYRTHNLMKPIVIEGVNYIKCILPRLKAQDFPAQKDDQAILDLFLRSSFITLNQVTSLGMSRATAGRRLKALVEKKLLQTTGRGPATRYTKT